MTTKRIQIESVHVDSGFVVELQFNDGLKKKIDLQTFFNGPVFEPLIENIEIFNQVKIEGGTLCWPTGADIDPYVLYYGSVENAERAIAAKTVSAADPN